MRTSQGIVIKSLRDFKVSIAFLQVIIKGIHKMRAMIIAETVEKIIEKRLGIDTRIAAIEEISHNQATQEHAPKNRLVFFRRYLAV